MVIFMLMGIAFFDHFCCESLICHGMSSFDFKYFCVRAYEWNKHDYYILRIFIPNSSYNYVQHIIIMFYSWIIIFIKLYKFRLIKLEPSEFRIKIKSVDIFSDFLLNVLLNVWRMTTDDQSIRFNVKIFNSLAPGVVFTLYVVFMFFLFSYSIFFLPCELSQCDEGKS